ncbi:MAG: NADH-quinone oxidoreductase subunit NuoB [Pseudomonadales bacterium]|nr:NADH-quinone oxidoreductase subunit NuoB [Pseudomonadales bacterium]
MWRRARKLIQLGNLTETRAQDADHEVQHSNLNRILGRALAIRLVDAGSCNGCELEIQALNNPYYNLEGMGIRFVASPRHADLLMVTGPVSRAMITALRRTYEAMPEPKLVLAVGQCTRDGGMFGSNYACQGGVGDLLPVDAYVNGCPPSPHALLEAILELVGRRLVDVR